MDNGWFELYAAAYYANTMDLQRCMDELQSAIALTKKEQVKEHLNHIVMIARDFDTTRPAYQQVSIGLEITSRILDTFNII